MDINFSNVGQAHTKKNYMDFLKPAAMVNAESIFKRLQLIHGTESFEAVTIASRVSSQIISSKGSELDQIWSKIEKDLHNRKPLKVTAKTPGGQLNTALGLIYSAMESVDKSDDIRQVRSIKAIYSQTKTIVESRFMSRLEGAEKRNMQRTLDTIDSFLDRMTKRFNERIKAQEIPGEEIAIS